MDDFKPRQSDELEFFAQETVYLIKKIDDDWYLGEVVSGEQGLVPSTLLGMQRFSALLCRKFSASTSHACTPRLCVSPCLADFTYQHA